MLTARIDCVILLIVSIPIYFNSFKIKLIFVFTAFPLLVLISFFSPSKVGAYENLNDTFPSFISFGNIGIGESSPSDTIAPNINLTNPLDGSFINGLILIQANAYDNVAVDRVEFYLNTNLLGISTTVPYQILWDSASVPDDLYLLHAIAIDTSSNQASSSAVFVTVDNTPEPTPTPSPIPTPPPDTQVPVVVVSNPVNGSFVSGLVDVRAEASDSGGVASVSFFVDGLSIGTDFSAPYSALWNTTSYIHNSIHTLVANAIDLAGNQASSSAVTVTVLDITAPAVSITSPSSGSTVPKNTTVTITANASDISGINRVEFYVNGVLACNDTTSSYSCNWKVPKRPNITYTLLAKAYDIAGNTQTHTITVTSR